MTAIAVRRSVPAHLVRRPPSACIVGDLTAAAVLIQSRIKDVRRRWGCGAYLYVDADRAAYVIPETRPIAELWVLEHFDWLVGRYVAPGRVLKGASLDPTIEGLAEDLGDHLRGLSYTTARAKLG